MSMHAMNAAKAYLPGVGRLSSSYQHSRLVYNLRPGVPPRIDIAKACRFLSFDILHLQRVCITRAQFCLLEQQRPRQASCLYSTNVKSASESKPDEPSYRDNWGKAKSDPISPGIRIALKESENAIITSEKVALEGVIRSIQNIFNDESPISPDVTLLQEEAGRLDDGLFLLVVCGEYNSGKSSVVNCLLGQKILEEGPTPTTAEVTLLKWGEKVSASPPTGNGGIATVTVPVDTLKQVHIVDTPGTNAINRKHEALTRDYVPRADLVLFITSADRPFSESERLFLQAIRDWGKKVVIVLNKTDLLDKASAAKVVNYVEDHARELLRSRPQVIPVSAAIGYKSKTISGDAKGWKESNFGILESYITELLDSDERLRVKLDSIAAVGLTLAKKYQEVLLLCNRILKADRKSLSGVEDLLNEYEISMREGFQTHFARIDNVFLEMLQRSDQFLNSRLVITNMVQLLYGRGIAKEYQAHVLHGMDALLEKQVREFGEWAAEKSELVFTKASELFQRRISTREDACPPIAPYNALSFDNRELRNIAHDHLSTRRALLSSLNDAAGAFASTFGAHTESLRIGKSVSVATATAFAAELGAIGALGALVQTASFDLASLAATSLLATAGLVVLPRKRRLLRREIRTRVDSIRRRTENEIRGSVEESVAGQVERIKEIVKPFRRFIEIKTSILDNQTKNLKSATEQLESVRLKVSNIRPMKKFK